MQLDCLCKLATRHRESELGHVTRYAVGVQLQLQRATDGSRQCAAAQLMERLVQRVPRVIGIAIGPEISGDAIACHSLLASDGKKCQNRQRLPLDALGAAVTA